MTPAVASGTSHAPHPPAGRASACPRVSFTRSGLTVPWDSQYGSLVEFAEACNVSVRWFCRMGVCHACESGLIVGSVRYNFEPLDRPAAGTVLICCSTPATEVEIDL